MIDAEVDRQLMLGVGLVHHLMAIYAFHITKRMRAPAPERLLFALVAVQAWRAVLLRRLARIGTKRS